MPWRLAAFAVWNAVTYASLLPLWDGFDEPFHYAYVQHLRTARTFPVHGETAMSQEIWQSLALAPASRIVHQNIPVSIPYDEYFAMSEARRQELRAKLGQLDPALATVENGAPNYEALQAPLAYVLLTPVDAALARVSLPRRVWLLRVVCGAASAILTILALLRLARVLGVREAWGWLGAFLAATLQMFYATTAHVANDWLAVPLYTVWLAAAVDLARRPDWRRLSWCVSALAAGLLSKAYFLSAIPVTLIVVAAVARRLPRAGWKRAAAAMGVCVVLAVAWYARNERLYRSVSGMQEVKGGTPLSTLIDAARRAPWGRSIDTTAHEMIWTGNNSDLSFHRKTVNLILALLALGVAGFVARRWSAGEAVAIGALAAYTAALGYSTGIKVFSTGGLGVAPSAWFVTPALLPLFVVAAAGLARLGRAGRAAGIGAAVVWTYVIGATYWVKLVPLYTGYTQSHARAAELWAWYTRGDATLAAIPVGGWIFAMAGVTTIAAIALAVSIARRIASA